jgi:hypothetical protein
MPARYRAASIFFASAVEFSLMGCILLQLSQEPHLNYRIKTTCRPFEECNVFALFRARRFEVAVRHRPIGMRKHPQVNRAVAKSIPK